MPDPADLCDADLPPNAISGRALTRLAEQVFGQPVSHPMFLCPMCGNKRCPKATDHKLECGGSNAPGQKGSVYE